MKTKWKGFAVLSCLLVIFSCNTVFASTYQKKGYQVEYEWFDAPMEIARAARFALLKQLGRGLTIENRIAYLYAESKSYEKLSHKLTVKLQESEDGENWSTIKTYTASASNATTCSIDKSYAVTMGYFYRLEVTIYLNNGKQTEEFTATTSTWECYDL